MRVAIDTNGVYTTQAGVARYIRGLLKGLRQVSPPDVDFFEFAWKVENFDYRQPGRLMRTAYRELIWAPLLAERILTWKKADLFHCTATALFTPSKRFKFVATLLDLTVLRYPERFRRWQRFSIHQSFRRLIKADQIICISQFTADEGMKLLGLPASKMDVIHVGCDFHSSEPRPTEQTPDFEVPDEFFLFVGSLEPGKNLRLLSEVYRMADETGRRLPALMIVGARREGVQAEGSPPPNWHYLGRQPDEVLVYLYRRALALVFPSKYEGFGLPVAEAMALGCPVICSRVASLGEVGGSAAAFTDLTPAAYHEKMLRLIHDSSLRSEFVTKGLQQAQKFSWKKCAEQTAQVYRQVFN